MQANVTAILAVLQAQGIMPPPFRSSTPDEGTNAHNGLTEEPRAIESGSSAMRPTSSQEPHIPALKGEPGRDDILTEDQELALKEVGLHSISL